MRATVVDHIVPHRGDQKLFWDRSNWQALCKVHHDKKTGLEDSRPTYHNKARGHTLKGAATISDRILLNRPLEREEVEAICAAHGVKAQPLATSI